MRNAGASRHIIRSVLLPLCETPTKKVGPAEAKHKHTHDLAKQLPIWRGHEHGHGHMGRFHQGSSSQSRKINCKWEANPFNGAAACILLHVLVVPVMLSSTRALATALLLVRAKRYQDQHDRLTTTVAASHHPTHSIMWVQYLSPSLRPANPPPCPAHSVPSPSRSQSSILVLLTCARPPNAEQRASARARRLFPSHLPGP